jgi:hypothetical protein
LEKINAKITVAWNEYAVPNQYFVKSYDPVWNGRCFNAFQAGYIAGMKEAAKVCDDLGQHYEHTVATEQCAHNITKRAGSFHGHD